MRKLTKARNKAETKLEMAIEYDVNIEYHRGYLQALKDVDEKNLSFNSKLDKVMKDKCIREYELVEKTGIKRQTINLMRIEGRSSETDNMKKIAKALDVNVLDILEEK